MCLEILTQGRSPLLSVKISLLDVFKQLLTLHKLTPTSDATSSGFFTFTLWHKFLASNWQIYLLFYAMGARCIFLKNLFSVADPEGVQRVLQRGVHRVRSKPSPLLAPFLNILWKWNNSWWDVNNQIKQIDITNDVTSRIYLPFALGLNIIKYVYE